MTSLARVDVMISNKQDQYSFSGRMKLAFHIEVLVIRNQQLPLFPLSITVIVRKELC